MNNRSLLRSASGRRWGQHWRQGRARWPPLRPSSVLTVTGGSALAMPGRKEKKRLLPPRPRPGRFCGTLTVSQTHLQEVLFLAREQKLLSLSLSPPHVPGSTSSQEEPGSSASSSVVTGRVRQSFQAGRLQTADNSLQASLLCPPRWQRGGCAGGGADERAAFRKSGWDRCQGSAPGKRAPAVLVELLESALLFFTRRAAPKDTEFPVSPAGKSTYFHSRWEPQGLTIPECHSLKGLVSGLIRRPGGRT